MLTKAFGCGCEVSRRRFFCTAGAAAATASATQAGAAETRPPLIDVHNHAVPDFWFEEVKDHIAAQGGGRIVPNWYGWSPERALAEMDKYGVATAMLSISAPGVWFGDVAASRRLARRCNEYLAGLARSHPGRFGGLMSLPYPDTEGSLSELAHGFDSLNLDGVGLFTSYGDKWLGDPSFWPVLEALNARRAVVYVHPVSPECCTRLMSYVPPFLTEFTQDTTRAMLSLIFSGAVEKFPDIRFIFSHAGGTLPVLAGRVSELAPSVPALSARIPDGIEPVMSRFYFELANSANRAAVDALTDTVPDTQVLFGTDFPLVPIGATAEGLTEVGFSRTQLQAVASGNALRLFGRSGAA